MRTVAAVIISAALLGAACGKKEAPTPPAAPEKPAVVESAAPPPPPPPPPGGQTAEAAAPTPAPADDAPTVIAIQELNTALRNYVSAKGRFPGSVEELLREPYLARKNFKLPPGRRFSIDQPGMQVTAAPR